MKMFLTGLGFGSKVRRHPAYVNPDRLSVEGGGSAAGAVRALQVRWCAGLQSPDSCSSSSGSRDVVRHRIVQDIVPTRTQRQPENGASTPDTGMEECRPCRVFGGSNTTVEVDVCPPGCVDSADAARPP